MENNILDLKEVGYIYKITNTVNNEVYIGQTYKDYNKRWQQHIRDGKEGKKKTKLVQAFIEYGVENFTFEVLETVIGYSGYLLDIKETEYIKEFDSYNNGLNSNCGANEIGNSEIKYISIIVNKLNDKFKDIKNKESYCLNKEDEYLLKAILFIQNSNLTDFDVRYEVFYDTVNVSFYKKLSEIPVVPFLNNIL